MIILIGASASGKTVSALGLAKKYGIKKAITTTTRKQRKNEVNGVDYFFLSKEEFLKKEKQHLFVETSIYNDNYYGCTIDQVDDNKVIVLDLNGLKSFLKLNNKNIVSFYLLANEKNRKERMILRGDEDSKIKERLKNDKLLFKNENIPPVDFKINTNNKTIEQVIDEIYMCYINKLKTN